MCPRTDEDDIFTIAPFVPSATILRATACATRKPALEIDVEHVIPFSLGQLQERRAGEHTRVVDEDVETAKPAVGLIDEARDIAALGHITLHS